MSLRTKVDAQTGQRVHVVYGAHGSASVAVEAALVLAGVPFKPVELPPWESDENAKALRRKNPLAQVPVLELPNGEVLTETSAILIYLGKLFTNRF